ncbi:MAG: PKD domain-containing protein [Flavobacteriales bacterium]|nr:PKD domain-containing protein [Flavobacteriales bacterium]
MKTEINRLLKNAFMLVAMGLLTLVTNDAYSQCASPHTTLMNYNNGQDGNMYNVTAINDVTIDSVWCNFGTGTISEIEIWYRAGTFVGNANSSAGWTKVDSVTSVPSAGFNNFTHVNIHINLQIPAGSTYALYVTRAQLANSAPWMRYTNGPGGSTAGQLYNQNADIQVSYAYGKDYPFGTTNFNPRIWNGRIFYSCCPQPVTPQGPITGDTVACIGDTMTYWVPWDSLAVEYEWTIPGTDSIISGASDSMMTMVVGPGSVGGPICVAIVDTCTTGPDTCITYTIDQPAAPVNITGLDTICQNDSSWYSVPPNSNVIAYSWSIPAGATIIDATNDSSSIYVKFGIASGDVCVQVTDDCATSDSTCKEIFVSGLPTLANAGSDISICQGQQAFLNANNPSIGNGLWTVVTAPFNNPGTFSDPTQHNATYTSNVPGQHVLQWETGSGTCPTSLDQMIIAITLAPTADFTTANVCEGTPVTFQDQSNGSVTSWLWDTDGDGVDNYIIQNPIHSYANPGQYTVRLIVNANGCADTLYKGVDVNPLPVVDMAADDDCFGTPTNFTNNSSITLGSIDYDIWDFGDGSAIDSAINLNVLVSALNLPNHTYSNPGTYTITNTLISHAGCIQTDVAQVKVFHIPVSNFTSATSCQFQDTKFHSAAQVGGGAQIASWLWTFNAAGDTSSTKHPDFNYTTNGVIPVRLQVWSTEGCYDDSIKEIEVYPTPTPEFNYTNRVCLGDLLELEDVSFIDYGTIDSINWTVADSFFYQGTMATHHFDEIGWYEVQLDIESNAGCKNTLTKEVPVYDIPFAEFEFESQCEDVAIQFLDSSKFSAALKSYKWFFGDSATSLDRNPTHTYVDFGTYDVTFAVETFKGCTDTITYPVAVYERPIPSFTMSPDSGCSPLYVEFEDATVSHTNRQMTQTWHYGDGFNRIDTAEYVYLNYSGRTRNYDVTLQITTDQGCVSYLTLDSAITLLPQPIADFESDPSIDAVSTVRPFIQFQNTSSQASRFKWRFGDGQSSTEHNPFYEYQTEGVFDVVLIAKNVFSCTDTIRKTAIVEHANILFVPSAFTPNGDGINDVFFARGIENVTDFKLEVFDRWGHVIHSEEGLAAFWDGRNNQSGLVQQGLYTYRISYVDKTGEEFDHQGSVSVIGVD